MGQALKTSTEEKYSNHSKKLMTQEILIRVVLGLDLA
jgi:hypothetical protein